MPNEIYKLIADTSLAEKELGFTAKTDFETGLKITLDSMKEKKLCKHLGQKLLSQTR